MREAIALSQGRRLTILVIEIVMLLAASKLALGSLLPPNGNQGFWFYTGLLGLIFGSRLDTPFFAKPADVILYAAPAAVALALANDWTAWDPGRRVAFVLAVFYCAAVAVIGGVAILTKDSTQERVLRASNVARVLGEVLGAPRIIYTVVVVFAIFAFHSGSAKEVGILSLAWMLTAILSPLEGAVRLTDRIKAIIAGKPRPGVAGEVAAYQTPGLVLIRRAPSSTISPGGLLVVKDPLGPRVLIALDHVGRDAGLLLRTLDTECLSAPQDVATLLRGLGSGDLQKIKPVSDVPALADASHAAAIPWRATNGGRVSVSAWVYPALKKGRRLWQLSARGVPKHVALKFTAETNVATPYEVYWQVVNTGQEAAAQHALRGEFTAEQKGTVRWETTAYAGTHWVEAFVVKDDVCVARSGRKLVKVWH